MRRRKFSRRKKQSVVSIILDLILILGIGYAIIQSNLNINGTANMGAPTWNIHWENVQVNEGSVSASTPTIDSAKTTVTYSVILNLPGDYYEFTVDAVNGGQIDAMIDTIDSKLNGATITTPPDYLEYTVSYYDGAPLDANHLLAAGTTEKYKVRIKYRDDINLNQIPASNQTLSLQFTVTYRQATDAAVVVSHPVSFTDDSWSTIVAAVQAGNTSNYNVGDTKTVDMGSLGTHTIRIANKSTPSECSTTGFSQTACGFVLEFADIIAKHNMNSTNTNVGGWPASELRTYVNSDIYNALPSELKSGIINTTVVSGHGSTVGESNFTSTDKLYLLSTHEVMNDEYYDTVYNDTRQLDYYSNPVTSMYPDIIKNWRGSRTAWWLRSAKSSSNVNFYDVNVDGILYSTYANFSDGVSPAFRIG